MSAALIKVWATFLTAPAADESFYWWAQWSPSAETCWEHYWCWVVLSSLLLHLLPQTCCASFSCVRTSTGMSVAGSWAEMHCSEVGERNPHLLWAVLWSFAGEVHAITPLSLVIHRDPPVLRSSLSQVPQSNTGTDTTAKTTFLQVYHVLAVPKHPLTSNPAHKMPISKEEAGTVLGFGLVEVWVVGTGCSPHQQHFALLVKGSWHSALQSEEIHKPDYIPKHMFGNEKQLSEVSRIALIENLKSRGGKPGSWSELPLGRNTGSNSFGEKLNRNQKNAFVMKLP